MISVRDVRRSARMAGNLVRYHSWPTLRQQTNAHHTWNVMRIYRELWGEMHSGVSDMILYHDAGELNAVDAAHDLKVKYPELKGLCDRMEADGLDAVGAPSWEGRVTDRERLRFKAADLLEMAEFAIEEQEMGNALMRPVTYNIEHALAAHVLRMEASDRQTVNTRVRDMNVDALRRGCGAEIMDIWSGIDRR